MARMIDFYAVLGVPRDASTTAIEAAYDSLLQHVESGQHELDAARARERIELLNQAYWALSNKDRRRGYDASLETATGMPVQFAVELRESRWTSPRGILNVIGRLIVMGLLIQIGFMLVRFYVADEANNGPTTAERERIQQGYDAMNGKLTAEERAAAEALAEQRRQEAEAERIRREEENARTRQEWALERDRRYAGEVSEELRNAEERERRKAEEERQRQSELDAEKQEQERLRIERLHEKWQSGSGYRKTRDDDTE